MHVNWEGYIGHAMTLAGSWKVSSIGVVNECLFVPF